MKRSLPPSPPLPSLLTALLAAASIAHANEPATGAYKGDPAKGKEIALSVCGACHGNDGNSATATNPKLAGQHPEYQLKQMKDFKVAAGKDPGRSNHAMNNLIAPYDENQMADLAAYYASQIQSGDQPKDPNIEVGQRLYRAGDRARGLPACSGCHGPAGAGIPPLFPRIGGQFADYIDLQLRAFRDGTRANDPNKMMRMATSKMTDAEIAAVADYVAGLR